MYTADTGNWGDTNTMNDTNAAMDKERLLTEMNASYERFETALADLSARQWLAVSSEDGAWSPRDMVAHLTIWLDQLAEEIEAVATDTPPKVSVAELGHDGLQEASADVHTARRKESPHQTLGEFRMAYGRLRDGVEVTSWDDLSAVGRFDWLGGVPLWRLIAQGTWEHFDKHLPDIERAGALSAD